MIENSLLAAVPRDEYRRLLAAHAMRKLRIPLAA